MIDARIIEMSGVEHVYQDIWDVTMDADSVTGVDFYQQVGRRASFGVLADDWLRDNFIMGMTPLVKGYLPFLLEIRKDGIPYFTGFCKNECGVEFDRTRMICSIQVCDLLQVLLDLNAETSAPIEGGTDYAPEDELSRILEWMIGTGGALFDEFGIGFDNQYTPAALNMNLLVFVPAVDWEDLPEQQWRDIVRQGWVAYEFDGWNLEYALHDRQIDQEQVYHNGWQRRYTVRQHLYWRRWKVGATLTDLTPVVDEISTHSREFEVSAYPNEAALVEAFFTWMRDEVPDITDNYDIEAVNGISNWTASGTQWRISDSQVQRRINPIDLLRTVDEPGEVGINDWLGAVLRVLCAVLVQDGRTLVAKARLNWPQEPGRMLTADEVLAPNPKLDAAGEVEISVSLPFIQDGQYIEQGIRDFFKDAVLGAMPRKMQMSLDGLDYELGGTLRWNGWLLMVTSIKPDLQKYISEITAMGTR